MGVPGEPDGGAGEIAMHESTVNAIDAFMLAPSLRIARRGWYPFVRRGDYSRTSSGNSCGK